MHALSSRGAAPLLALAAMVVAVVSAPALGQADRPAEAAEAFEPVGPMVGHVTHETATLWAFAGPGATFDVRVWRRNAPADAAPAATASGAARPEMSHAAIVTVEGLRPDTRYRYAMRIDGRESPRWAGRFRTPPPPGVAKRFTMAFSSCMNVADPNQSSWYLLLARAPAFHLLLGDNHYADTTDHDAIWAAHLRYRRVPEFAGVIRNVPTYAMWDDHDYGPNNSDSTEPGKADSLRAFREVFANPGAGTPDVPGAFYRFSWGDVDFFVVDERYHRSPNDAPNDEHKRMLGDGQFEWLMAGLRESTAPFKVIASGSTLRVSEADGWRLFDFARKRLFRSIMDERIAGVLYLSGDVHRCLLDVHGPEETGGYPIFEVISSGITRGKDRGFATLTFDTTRRDPTVRVRIVHGDATVALDRTIRASELQVPK
jgi:alkaline phosphatase D